MAIMTVPVCRVVRTDLAQAKHLQWYLLQKTPININRYDCLSMVLNKGGLKGSLFKVLVSQSFHFISLI